jgi:hypothetical protein
MPLDRAGQGREKEGRGWVAWEKMNENRAGREEKRKGKMGLAARGFRPKGILGFSDSFIFLIWVQLQKVSTRNQNLG